MKIHLKSYVVLFVLSFLMVGCASKKETFYWGEYENILYEMYTSPGSSDVPKQISILSDDINKAQAKGKQVAPGMHAHLGYMFALAGNISEAKAAFLVEKENFPESAIMVDGMLGRLEGQK